MRNSSIDVDVSFAADLPPVEIDAIQIQQVLVNLIRNSVDAMTSMPRIDRQLRISTQRLSSSHVDVRLPGMSGIDFVHQMFGNGSQVPTIIVSGHDESLAIDELLKLDHVWYMKKPYAPNDLLHCIQLGLDLRAIQQSSKSQVQRSKSDKR